MSKYTTFVTAMTGIASLNIKGMTLHRFAGIGTGIYSKEKLFESVRVSKKGSENWKMVETLIIDEISMLDAVLFEKIEYIARKMKEKEVPFGGIQIVMCGDFYQLPPVSKEGKAKFCFESPLWNQLFNKDNMIELTKIFRQADGEFIQILKEIRNNNPTQKTVDKLKSLGRPLETPPGIVATRLYSKV